MNLKLAACLVVLVALAGSLLWIVGGERGGEPRGRGAPAVEARAEAPEQPLVESAAPAASSAPALREAERAAGPAPTEASWRAQLAGVVGRVVESDGRPVAGMRVSLLEADITLFFDGTGIDAEEPSLELEATVTDREGRFVLSGARAAAFHGLGVDLGGPRSTVRVLDHALVQGERTDVGDVVLAPFGVVTGRVLDESGAPVSGARVRLAPLPPEILAATVHEFRSDSLVAVGLTMMGGEGFVILEPPGWIAALIERLPVPTTYTAADGTFRLEGVALAHVVGGIDKSGQLGIPLGPLDVTDGEEALGDLVMKAGRTIRGVVEDEFGEPAVGAEVWAGAEIVPGTAAILHPCGKTDADGRFEVGGALEAGLVVATARRSRHEPWTTVSAPNAEKVLLEIPGTVQLAVNVRDPSGKPVSGARVRVMPIRNDAQSWGIEQAFVFLPRPVSAPEVFREVEPGRYVAASLTTGTYDVTARAAGLAPGLLRTECLASTNEATLVLSAGHAVDVTVVDKATKEPVPGARASLLRIGEDGLSKLAGASVGSDGKARLGPISEQLPRDTEASFMPRQTILLVEHPRYGDSSQEVPPGLTSLVVELANGGALSGRVHWGGAVPQRLYMLMLGYRSESDGFLEAFHPPRFTVTDLEGGFQLANLPAGKHRVELVERFLDQDPIGSVIGEDFDVATLYRGEVEIREGETTELEIDLTPTGRGATARVVGQVRVFGRNLAGAEVSVRGNESVEVKTDERGRFETPEFAVRDRSWITVTGPVPLSSGRTRTMRLYQEQVALQHQDVHEILVDANPLVLRVAAVDAASGAPLREANVSVRAQHGEGIRHSDEASTDDSGEAELLVLGPGQHVVEGHADGYGRASTTIDVPPEGLTATTTLRLSRSVPCSGRVDVAPADVSAEGRGFAYVQVRSAEGGYASGAMLRPPDYTFELEGLAPGEYRHNLFINGLRGEEGTFTLGPDGATDLVLTFVPSPDDD